MYPKDRLPRGKTQQQQQQQMPPNLVTLFSHVMTRANEGSSRAPAIHGWEEVLNSAAASSSSSSSSASSSSSGTTSPGPFCPMSAQDWRKVEAFSVHLQSLLATRHTLRNSTSNSASASNSNGGGRGGRVTAASASTVAADAHGNALSGRASSPLSDEGKLSTPHANCRAKSGRAKPLASDSAAAGAATAAAGTPNPAPAWPHQHAPRVTPKDPSRGSGGEPSAPIKAVGRVAASRRVNGSAECAVASLAVSRAGPGAFETPSHTTSHHHLHHPGRQGGGLPGADDSNPRGREHSPSRYPARLRSRRFPQLGSGGESPEPPQPRGLVNHDHAEELVASSHGRDTSQQGEGRLGPRNSPPTSLVREHGCGVSSDGRRHHPHDWLISAAGGAQKGATGCGSKREAGVVTHVGHDGSGHDEDGRGGTDGGEGYGMRTRAAPKASHELDPAARATSSRTSSISPLPGACTPQMGIGTAVVSPVPMEFRQGPPPIFSAAAAAAAAVAATAAGGNGRPSPRAAVAAPRPRQVLQGGRSGGRAPPLPRSSVGGRNYTDNHVKQLGLIETAVVASATARDHATYNLPRQGRTLTLTNVFKFIALRGAGAMYRLAMDKHVEAHTGRHSNFFDGKIDARIVGVIKKDIGDEVITKSRKFSKILLSLVAEGCSHPDCDWDHTSFTSDKIANFQARIEAQTGTSALKFCSDPAVFLAHAAAAAAAGAGSAGSSASRGGGGSGTPSLPPGASAFVGGAAGSSGSGSTAGGNGGAHSKRRLDLGRDDAGQTPSPRLKKLKRAAKARVVPAAGGGVGVESTPTGDGIGNSKSPPKEEDDMRAAEVLQGLKGIVGSQ
ncbi:unnamed protein product [Pylaiella littoralis]